MNILLLSGFLGSGKTSVLLQLAKHIADTVPGDGMKVMIIENEIGEVGVDDKILRAQGLVKLVANVTAPVDELSDFGSLPFQ